MRKIMTMALAFVLAGTVAVQAYADSSEKTIVENAVEAKKFTTLVAAVKAAGLAELLSSDGPFTVLAPTDEAFKALPDGTVESLLQPENKGKLVSILKYHVIPGKVMSSQVVKLDDAKTAQGSTVSIMTKDGTVMINKAKVVKADIESSNGVIHVIDKVLLPKE
ncbi:fasciclin domain-containing protein [Stieleria sp. JC731]|uniref:fasciclin domain-containing protein n=1 Tax=Pirellulaceae TaxID=2691357 RepID=UPI001E558778|nr:fasciclin domain-containing protein [Stieleria sp. JC731]MCC9599680.1 fasciclin domain-containing protein [Stieleria sp. JC731]